MGRENTANTAISTKILLIYLIIHLKSSHMQTIRLWAKAHPAAAQVTIVCSHVALAILALNLGLMLYRDGVQTGLIGLLAPSIALLWGALMYPRRKNSEKELFRMLRSRYDLAILVAGFILTTSVFNYSITQAFRTATPSGYQVIPAALRQSQTHTSTRSALSPDAHSKKKAGWKKSLRSAIKAHFLQNQKEGGKVRGLWYGLIFLLSGGLSLLVTALSCNLACSGAGAAAVLVGLVGAGAIVFLTGILLRAVLPEEKKKKAFLLAAIMLLGSTLLWVLLGSIL
ncbi:MAG: hypothetical protein KIPDCIKN_03430 [Haliscomenobacter sp.]|jgi:hypothetical protein|nr:hypothetical protein [Haliscomenobacter sp.]